MDKQVLINCFEDTMKIAREVISTETSVSQKTSVIYKENFAASKKTFGKNAKVEVHGTTTFLEAGKHKGKGKIAVLNFANPETPGGGVTNGAMAQEECLCRCSNLYPCLNQESVFEDYYNYHRKLGNHFYTDRIIYSPGITVFKDEELQLMPQEDWFQVDVITCAAPYLAKRKHTNQKALLELFKGRVQNIFEVAAENNVDILILGAFGCGAFKNPPTVVAKAFHEVIDENKYREQFRKIIFAIKSTVNDDPFEPCPNIMAFEYEFFRISAEANKLRFSDPYPLVQAFGQVVMPSGRVLKGGKEFNLFDEWRRNNKYYGKQFSIVGDSISTLAGYNPKGYHLYYAGQKTDATGVKDIKDTWWGKVIDFFGGELLVNNSWSGSRVAKLPNQTELFPSACSDERTASLHINSVTPDVIIVYMGTNDWANGVIVHSKSGHSRPLAECFDFAYISLINKIKSNYPGAEIWCCTLSETYMSQKPSFKFPHKYAGTYIEEYNDIIRRAAHENNCKLIDMYGFGIPYDSIDGTHPSAEGMITIALEVIRSAADNKVTAFLDCKADQHQYHPVEEYTGGTKYICKKCGSEKHTNTLFSLNDADRGNSINGEKYFLFACGTVVKESNGLWYRRDKTNHCWINDHEWMRRYFDAEYDVIKIKYDEFSEEITEREIIPEFYSGNINKENLAEFGNASPHIDYRSDNGITTPLTDDESPEVKGITDEEINYFINRTVKEKYKIKAFIGR